MQNRFNRQIRWLFRAPALLAIGTIAVYQVLISPLKFFLTGGMASCRFYPTCSCYTRDCLRQHGFLAGIALGLWRLLKCHPFHPGGFDPVPERPFRRCERGSMTAGVRDEPETAGNASGWGPASPGQSS